MHESRVSARLLLAIALAAATLLAGPGCVTRNARENVLKRHLMEVDLVREVRGFTPEEKGYDHPAIISAPRLANILGALEVEVRDGAGVVRQPAVHRLIVEDTAEALSQGLAEAGPNAEIAVKAIRKQMRAGVFHKKYLTSFLAHVKDGHLYISLRRIDWLIPQSKENERLPNPLRDRKNMNFRVVTGEPIFFAGVQDLEIDWRHDAFRGAFQLPGSTGGEKKRREVLESIPVPKEELRAGAGDDVSIGDLSPEKLRALADLEEERRSGRMTETDYQRAKRQLLRRR